MTKTTNSALGNLIRSARQAKGMTQEELGKKVGVTKAIISKYETGQITNFSRPRIQALSDALDISPLKFVGFESPQPIVLQKDTIQKLADALAGLEPSSELARHEFAPEAAAGHSGKKRLHAVFRPQNALPGPASAGPSTENPKIQLSEEEFELLRTYRELPVKLRMRLLNTAYQLEEEVKRATAAAPGALKTQDLD